jgi:uncharacterized protein YjdB
MKQGILGVAADETATILRVRATSAYDTGKSGTAIVAVIGAAAVPAVTGVTVHPDTATVGRGQTRTFTATVAGTDNPSQTVTWTVEGSGSGTGITGAGLLTVGADESAPSLTVRATSAYDTGKSGTATVFVINEGAPPTVTEVTVDPDSATVGRGQTRTFTATVAGTNNPPQNVTWSVEGGIAETTVTNEGELRVATNETASILIIRATSTYDTGKSGTASVTVPPTVTGLTVSPNSATVRKGEPQTFSATVAGLGNPSQTVTWSVEGGGSGTSITPAGLLTVAAAESASSLTVRATSAYDTGKSGTAAVTVTGPGEGGVTLIYPEDPATNAFPDNITLSKSGTGNLTERTLTVSGTYDTYRWRIDGSIRGNGKSIVLNAASYTTGAHRISVEVTRNGVVYSKSGSFRVEN